MTQAWHRRWRRALLHCRSRACGARRAVATCWRRDGRYIGDRLGRCETHLCSDRVDHRATHRKACDRVADGSASNARADCACAGSAGPQLAGDALGIGSLITVPSAGTLPPLITVTVYSIVPPMATVCRSAVLLICSCGVELPVTDAMHGGAITDAAFACAAFISTPHTPPPDGVTLAVLVMVAGGALLTVAVTV